MTKEKGIKNICQLCGENEADVTCSNCGEVVCGNCIFEEKDNDVCGQCYPLGITKV